MKQIHTSKGKWLFVEVPKDAKTLGDIADSFELQAKKEGIDLDKTKFIATTSTITEEQALSIVEHMYAYPRLLHANNLTAPNYAILKVI